MTNRNMHFAKRAKNDEFYTQLTDIENELQYYKEHFKNKVVLCNCNDAVHGNFVRYFKDNFNDLELQKIIYTSYGDNAYAYVYDGKETNNWKLKENGDFRSEEMIELLKKADIVCTNPPFSQFREYVAQLMEYDKKFLIIGNMNAINCKEIFPYIKANKMWLGTQYVKEFIIRDGETQKFGNILWYTNLLHKRRTQPIDLYKYYNEEEYPKYDNYDAINVNKVTDIPLDYDGVMGVPISFLDKYCPTQFEILGCTQRGCHELVPDTKKYNDFWEVKQDGTKTGSSGNKTNENPNLRQNDGVKNYFINEDGYVVQSLYGRIFIRKI